MKRLGTMVCVVAAVALTTSAAASVASAAPVTGKLRVSRGTSESTNWSGYAAFGTTFTDVKGSWTQPGATCPTGKANKTTAAAFWSGLDGYLSRTVEQTGTEVDCFGARPVYYAWYEFYPAGVVVLSQTDHKVAPGDKLAAEVTQDGTTVTVRLRDATQRWTASASRSAAGLAFSSAEWIAEAPSPTLTNFASVGFNSANATDNAGHTGPIDNGSYWNDDKVILVNNNGRRATDRAVPTDLTSGGTAFTVNWLHG